LSARRAFLLGRRAHQQRGDAVEEPHYPIYRSYPPFRLQARVLNSVSNRDVLTELGHALHEIREDPSVRIVIVTGSGERAFIAGADIAAMSEMSTSEGLEFSRMG